MWHESLMIDPQLVMSAFLLVDHLLIALSWVVPKRVYSLRPLETRMILDWCLTASSEWFPVPVKFISNHGSSDSEEVVTPLILDGTYLSRNFATLEPLTWQPPCELEVVGTDEQAGQAGEIRRLQEELQLIKEKTYGNENDTKNAFPFVFHGCLFTQLCLVSFFLLLPS